MYLDGYMNKVKTEKRGYRQFFVSCTGLVILPVSVALANGLIVTDGTVGSLSGPQILSDANQSFKVNITQEMGSTVGRNLFHSFSEFNINSGQTVTFTGSSALQNVIARVTGPNASDIDGKLQSLIPKADFYFINPHGVTFGQNAKVDVPAAFHVSSADHLQFKDGNLYSATNPGGSNLSSAEPAAFGFLGTSSATNGLIAVDKAKLYVKAGQTLDVVAGTISVEGITTEDSATLKAAAGEMRLVAMRGAGSVTVARDADGGLPLPVEEPTAMNAGPISVNADVFNNTDQFGDLDTAGNGGGRLALWGGDIAFSHSSIYNDNNGPKDASLAKGVDIRSYSLKLDNSFISFDALSSGKAGPVRVQAADSMTLNNYAYIKSNSFADGDAGALAVQAKTLDILAGGNISASTHGLGNAGSVTVTADTLTVDRQDSIRSTGIRSAALSDSVGGKAGNVSVQAAGKLDVLNGGDISSNTFSLGDAGRIDIKAGTLGLFNGGVVSSSTSAQGNAGNISLKADAAVIDSQGNNSRVTGITSQANDGSGHAGDIDIQSGRLDILNGGLVSSSTFAEGNAGDVVVTANAAKVDGRNNSAMVTGIITRANQGSLGRAGNVNIRSLSFDIVNGGNVSSSTFAEGHAGNVSVNADTVSIDGQGSAIATGIFSEAKAESGGQVGQINVQARNAVRLSGNGKISIENAGNILDPSLLMPGGISVTAADIDMNNGSISTNATGNVSAGNVSVNFSHWLTMDPSFIRTTANTGNGGKIIVSGGELIFLQNSGFITTVSGSDSNGGDISVPAGMLVMDNGVIQANAVSGTGGNISLNVKALIPSSSMLILGGKPVIWQPTFNLVQAASQAGISGTVSVTTPQLNLSGIIANLGGPQYNENIINQDYCELVAGSYLTRKGAGGLKLKGSDLQLF